MAGFFAAERFFWGAGYNTRPDGMHFEASNELIADWKAAGTSAYTSLRANDAIVVPKPANAHDEQVDHGNLLAALKMLS